jgi:crotonobetainyl-CoA:carnitine CoA-transferase CaiB-like acyl-CoA transferase
MLDNMLSLNEQTIMSYSFTGESLQRGRPKHLYPRGAFRCRDGYLALSTSHCRTPLHPSAAPEIPATPAPRLGEHTLPILRDVLGYPEAEIQQLADENVVEIWEG